MVCILSRPPYLKAIMWMKIMSWLTAVLPVLCATSYSIKYSQKQITPTLLFKRIYNCALLYGKNNNPGPELQSFVQLKRLHLQVAIYTYLCKFTRVDLQRSNLHSTMSINVMSISLLLNSRYVSNYSNISKTIIFNFK